MGFFEVRNLNFLFKKFSLFSKQNTNKILTNINFNINKILGLPGVYGCGKSTLAKIMMGLLKLDNGEIRLNDKPVLLSNLSQNRELYRQIQIAFQDSLSAVNPRFCLSDVLEEPLIYLSELNSTQRLKRIKELLPLLK